MGVEDSGTLDERALDRIRSFAGGDRILVKAVGAYLRDAADELRGLQHACATTDRETVQRITHTLKSSSAMLGASRLAALLGQMEQEAPTASAEVLVSSLASITEECARVERELGALDLHQASAAPAPPPDHLPLVLVVDDEATSRVILAELLRADGFRVVEAADGTSALERVVAIRPDLVVLDVVMPGLDGFEVCARIRALPAVALTPVLVLTALDDAGALERAFGVGATDFVTKPVAPILLTHRVRFLLRMSAALEEARRSEARLAEAQRIARVGNWEWHVPAGVFRGSAEACRLLGLGMEASEYPIDRLYHQVVPGDREQLKQELSDVSAGGATLNCEHQVAVEGWPTRQVHLLGEAVRGEEGVSRVMGTVQDVTERAQTQLRIQTLAYHDALTGLPNRRLFSDQLHKVLAAARRKERRAAVLLVDLDDFKRINDTLGHSTGDHVLVEVAGRLREVVRAYDTVGREYAPETLHTIARLGGDEFLVAIADLNSGEDAAIVAGRVLKAFAAPLRIAGQDLIVSASIGISVFPEDGADLESLLKHADMALYQAKDAGRNTGEFFNQSMNAVAHRRLLLETNLRRAVERDEIAVHFQPLVDARAGRPIGVEALLWWTDPELGPVAPEQFVPVAERIGLITALTELALRRTCEQLVAWHAAGFKALRASINLSPHLLRRPDVVQGLAGPPTAAGLDPGWIELEITETALMGKPQEAERVLAELKVRGFRLSLDDFGTGYSSLSHLRRFPFDTLKIDRAFVQDVAVNQTDAAIVAAIVTLARSLRLEPVAEGVESDAQRRVLLQQGCVFMQGYLFGRPMPAEECGRFLAQAGAAVSAGR